MAAVIQRSFAGGELAPSLAARGDQDKYATGADLMENFQVMRHGGATTRQGLAFVAEVKDDNAYARLLKFVFNDEQSYILEFGAADYIDGAAATTVNRGYMRVYKDGAQLVVTADDHDAWANLTAYDVGDLVSFGGNAYYCMIAHTSSTSLEPTDAAGTVYWYLLVGDDTEAIYEIPTPYAAADIEYLYAKQSLDVVWVTCRNTETLDDYAPYELRRTGHVIWTLTLMPFLPGVEGPVMSGFTQAGGGGIGIARYTVTIVQKGSLVESLPGYSTFNTQYTGKSLTTMAAGLGLRVANGGAHALIAGDRVKIKAVTTVSGAPNELLSLILLNGVFTITLDGTDNFYLDGTDGIPYTDATATVDWSRAHYYNNGMRTVTPQNFVTMTWTDVPSAYEYNIYKEQSGVYGYIGTAKGTTFIDTGITPDYTITPPEYNPQFLIPDKRPGVVGMFQQRLFFGASNDEPQSIWASCVGDFNNFTTHSPLVDSDALQAALVAEQANDVRHLEGIGQLFVMTRGQKLLAQGDSEGSLSAVTGLNLSTQAFGGVATIPPVKVQESLLYIQARGIVVRDTREEQEGFRGRDLTVYASHLFAPGCGCSAVEWDYAENPDSIIWLIRVDGLLLGLTYIREHNIWAWHRHTTAGTTQGLFRSVKVIPENNLDTPYFIIDREIDGEDKRFIERMRPRCGTCVA